VAEEEPELVEVVEGVPDLVVVRVPDLEVVEGVVVVVVILVVVVVVSVVPAEELPQKASTLPFGHT